MNSQNLEKDERQRDDLETLRDIALADQQILEGRGIPHSEARKTLLSNLDK